MIRLYTGLPGHGKTLAVIALIASWNDQLKQLIERQEKGKELTDKEKDQSRLLNRKIIIAGIDHIKEHKFPYLKFQIIEYKDVLKWKTDYHDAVIIIDEAQEIFPQRQRGKAPDYITDLSTHRHNGLDLYFITQNPMLLDAWARKLVDEHIHVKRLFSTSIQLYFKWTEGAADINDRREKRFSSKSFKLLNKNYFDFYQSASSHSSKSSIPLGVKLGILLFLIFVGVSYYVYKYFTDHGVISNTESSTQVKTQANQLQKPPIKPLNNTSNNKPNNSYVTLADEYPLRLCNITGSLQLKDKKIVFITLHFQDGSIINGTVSRFREQGFDIRKRADNYFCSHVPTVTGKLPSKPEKKKPKSSINNQESFDIHNTPINPFSSS